MNEEEEIKSESERDCWMKTVSERGMRTLYMSHNALSIGEVTASNEMCSRVTNPMVHCE